MGTMPRNRSGIAVLTERISHLCEKIDDLEENMRRLDGRLNEIPNPASDITSLRERVSSLESWHTWGIRILGSAFIVQTIALLYEMAGK